MIRHGSLPVLSAYFISWIFKLTWDWSWALIHSPKQEELNLLHAIKGITAEKRELESLTAEHVVTNLPRPTALVHWRSRKTRRRPTLRWWCGSSTRCSCRSWRALAQDEVEVMRTVWYLILFHRKGLLCQWNRTQSFISILPTSTLLLSLHYNAIGSKDEGIYSWFLKILSWIF